MKKFLTMFAFAAAIVLGAFTLASCGDDDNSSSSTHKFSYKFIITTDIAANQDALNTTAESFNKIYNSKELSGTEAVALIAWNTMTSTSSAGYKEMQSAVDEWATSLNDKTIKLTLKMLKDGSEWKSQTWTATK